MSPFKPFSRKCLTVKIKLIKTAKLLFGHCWAIYCPMGKDKSNTYLIFISWGLNPTGLNP